jgi:ADP-heptose:LPS heptosyltransferase
MKAIGWNLGQRGDIVMNTVVARGFKEEFPNSHLTLGIYKEYADMKDLFKHHPYIDDIHIYDSYHNWPNDKDTEFIKNSNFDKVYNGMPQHSRYDWYNYCESQTEEACLMNGIKPPKNLQCNLTKWFDNNKDYSNFICIAPFSSSEKKDLSMDKANEIVKLVKELGFEVLQLSSTKQPKLNNVTFNETDYFNSVVNMLSCKLLITINTGMSWVSSAYNHKTLGLYSIEHWGYEGLKSSKIYEPINPNAIYLKSSHPNDIILDDIRESLLHLLKI